MSSLWVCAVPAKLQVLCPLRCYRPCHPHKKLDSGKKQGHGEHPLVCFFKLYVKHVSVVPYEKTL